MLAFFMEFAFLKASFLRNEKEVLRTWISLGCFYSYLYLCLEFGPLEDSKDAQARAPSFISLISHLQLPQ